MTLKQANIKWYNEPTLTNKKKLVFMLNSAGNEICSDIKIKYQ